ncbi:MAG: hypothetical protein LC723_10475 [Actinobacteria bacterium]|nr:hypothetical protein [Actinomycetota bacterium]
MLTLAFAITVGLQPEAQAKGPVTVSGTVHNGTAGAAIPPAISITIARLTASGKELERREAGVAADGRFSMVFDETPLGHFIVATTYKGVTYSNVADASGSNELAVDLVIYETTDDDSIVRIDSDTMTVVKGKQDTYEILQLFKITNASDRTFVGHVVNDSPQVISLPVATGGTSLAPGEGLTADRVTTNQDGIASGDPLQPGTTTVSFVYKVKATRTGWPLTRTTAYPTSHIDLLAGPGLTFISNVFRFAESKRLGGKLYRRYRAGPLDPGTIIDGNIEERNSTTSGLMFGLGAGLFAIIAIALGTGLYRRKVSAKPAAVASQSEAPFDMRDDRDQLILKIAELDERFDAGTLPEAEYRQARATLKEALLNTSVIETSPKG